MKSLMRRLSKSHDIPLEQYGYWELEFDSEEEIKEKYLKIRKIISEVENSAVEKGVDTEFKQEGSFMKRKDK